jgi:hypothetical protein
MHACGVYHCADEETCPVWSGMVRKKEPRNGKGLYRISETTWVDGHHGMRMSWAPIPEKDFGMESEWYCKEKGGDKVKM